MNFMIKLQVNGLQDPFINVDCFQTNIYSIFITINIIVWSSNLLLCKYQPILTLLKMIPITYREYQNSMANINQLDSTKES